MDIVLLATGILLGYFFYMIDCVLYALYLHPEDETSRHLVVQLKQHRYLLASKMMVQMSRSPKHYIHKSAKFLTAFALLSLFVATSTDSAIAQGILLGFGLYTTFELLKVRRNSDILREKFLWDFSPSVPHSTISLLVNGLFLITALLLVTAFLRVSPLCSIFMVSC